MRVLLSRQFIKMGMSKIPMQRSLGSISLTNLLLLKPGFFLHLGYISSKALGYSKILHPFNICSFLRYIFLLKKQLKYHETGKEKECLPQVGQWNMVNKACAKSHYIYLEDQNFPFYNSMCPPCTALECHARSC